MKHNIKIYGKSQFANKIHDLFNPYKWLNVEIIEHCPSQKVNGLVICFLDDLNVFKAIEFSQKIKNHRNDCVFISALSNKHIVLGTTFVSEGTACFESVLYHLLFNKLNLSDEEFNKFRLPEFNVVLNNSFYKSKLQSIADKLIREVNVYFSNEIQNFNFLNKVELLSVKNNIIEEEFVLPLKDEASIENQSYFPKNRLKLLYSEFISSEKIIQKGYDFNMGKHPLIYKSIGVIGGGTAGYLTALALKQKFPKLEVTIVESSKIPIIGVGEATTPIIRKFLFQELKFNKLDFYSKVQPTWKLGIKLFWGLKDDYYFNYPFGPTDIKRAFLNGDINNCNLNSVLMSRDTSFVFKQDSVDDFSLEDDLLYAYHLDNKKFVNYLKSEALERGIHHKDAEIKDVVSFQNKEGVDYLNTKEGEQIKFDFYADCTGFNSLLIGKSLGSKFISYEDSLYTDSAIVANVSNNGVVKPYTYAESMNSGWCWNTPLKESDHRGYVFSSAYCSEEEAVVEMKKKNPLMSDHRLVKFKSGRHSHFAKANVVAIGNSHGFVEPLASTGIHMIIREIQLFRDNFELLSTDRSNSVRNLLNENINGTWDYLRWFLAIHYKYNKKFETNFWKDSRENVNISGLEPIIDIYKNLGLLSQLPQKIKEPLLKQNNDDLFGLAGIDNILLGQGVVPKNMMKPSVYDKAVWQHHVNNWNNLADISVG